MKKILHILSAGDTGGIEALCSDYAYFSKHENIFLFLWGGGYNAEKIREMGKKVYILNASKKHFFSLRRKAENICVTEKVNVVIMHHSDIYAHVCMMLLRKKIKNIKIIAYAHANAIDMSRADKIFWEIIKKKILKWSLSKSDRVIAVSESVKESVVSIFEIPRDHVAVIYNGVNIGKFGCKAKFKEKCIQIVYVGRLIEEKGVQITLQALSLLPNEERYRFFIVGDGPYKRKLEEMTEKLKLGSHIFFAGERHDIPQFFDKADVFIHMPVYDEGFGIAVIEAMAARVICICARSGALSEIIEDGKNGFLVPKGDPQALADKLMKVIKRSDLDVIRENAHERALEFSIENFVEKLDYEIEMNL